MSETHVPADYVAEKTKLISDEIESVIVGKRSVIELALTAMLSGGHVLIEDIPGVGKTSLAKSLAKATGCVFKRVQFTPDLLPADITGSAIFNQRTTEFEFREGPVFAHVVLADEINRASPRTQSALLECMEEHQVTSDGVTYHLPSPFFVIATENHIESHGTYPLPEAQLDRFLMRISIGYPGLEQEIELLGRRSAGDPIAALKPVISRDELLRLQAAVQDVHVDKSLHRYIIEIVTATRQHPQVNLGASPRGSLYMYRACQAFAATRGRTYVLPDDIKYLAPFVLAHRMIMRPDTRTDFATAEGVLGDILARVAVPVLS